MMERAEYNVLILVPGFRSDCTDKTGQNCVGFRAEVREISEASVCAVQLKDGDSSERLRASSREF